ncbi:MAG: hypothetical protein WAT20_04380, partial [Ferruginibacter sp.]
MRKAVRNEAEVSRNDQYVPLGAVTMTGKMMTGQKKYACTVFLTICFLFSINAFSQLADAVYKDNIKAVRFHMYG